MNNRSTEILEKARTNNGIGFRISDYGSDYIYQGKGYYITNRFTVAAGTNLIILFDMTNCNRSVTLYTPTADTTTGPIFVDYYIGSDYVIDDATILTPMNRAYYGDTSQVQVSYGADANYTGTSKGVGFGNDMIVSGHKSGGSNTEQIEFLPTPKQKILIEYDNTNGTEATMSLSALWFEV